MEIAEERDPRVRIHVDQQALQSPNPTTGIALYELANIHEHHLLYREVTGNREDELIPRDHSPVQLEKDEHFHSAKEKRFTIVVNLSEAVVDHRLVGFEEVVKIAYPSDQPDPTVVYTVLFSRAAGERRDGTLERGQEVKIKNGTTFDVGRTYKS